MSRSRRIRRMFAKCPFGVRADGTAIVPSQPLQVMPNDADVYSGPLPAWAQRKIDSIIDRTAKDDAPEECGAGESR